jgi:Tfp pilus assembly protein PilE
MRTFTLKHLAMIAAVPAVLLVTVPAWAASVSKSDAAKAISAAAATMKTAASYDNQWLETEADFKAAKAAEAKGDFALAKHKADRADTLAKLSIGQSKAQKKLWQNEVPK